MRFKLIPDKVTSIGDSAFCDCTSLTQVSIGNACLTINNSAFNNCSALTSISFGSNLNTIGEYAFYGCTKLTSVVFRDNLLYVKYRAFHSCTNLVSVRFGKNLISIDGDAFQNCQNLRSVELHAMNTTINKVAFPIGQQLSMYCYAGSTIESYANSNDNKVSYMIKRALKPSDFTLSSTSYTWTGASICPAVKCTSGLVSNLDYSVIYDYEKTTGKHVVSIYGINSYNGLVELSYTVNKANQTISASNLTKPYSKGVYNLGAKVTFGDGTLFYTSSNKSVAIVNPKGQITVYKPGTTTITANSTAHFNAASKKITLNVVKAKQKISKVSSSYSRSLKSKTMTLTPKSNGGGKISYESSNTKIASVTSDGKVTFRNKGTVTITIKASATTCYNSTSKKVTLKIK